MPSRHAAAAPRPNTAKPAAQASAQGISATFNDVDATFIKDMAPHHSSALAMADLAATRAANSEVKAIAAKISKAQEPEIERMKAMASTWKVELPKDGQMGSMGGTSAGGGMNMGADDVTVLTPLTGAAFDKEFLTRMVAHHTSAVTMAEVEVKGGENPQAKDLAKQIIAAQKKEITQMNDLLPKV